MRSLTTFSYLDMRKIYRLMFRPWSSGGVLALLLSLGVYAAQPVDLRRVEAHDPGSSLADGWQHGAFMEIFVRGYRDTYNSLP